MIKKIALSKWHLLQLLSLLLLPFIIVGCSHSIDKAESMSSTIEDEKDINSILLSSIISNEYWTKELNLFAATQEELSTLHIGDARSEYSPVWISEFVPRTNCDDETVEVVTLGKVPSLNFYVYTFYSYHDSSFQGFIVDYGNSQHLYYFLDVAHPCSNMPEFYIDENQEIIYMLYQAAGGSSISAQNLCAFQLNDSELSLYQADFYDVADQLAQCLSITYDNISQEIIISQNDKLLGTTNWDTLDFTIDPTCFYCGSQLTYRYQNGTWYLDCGIEIMDASGTNTTPARVRPKISAKICFDTNETGKISNISFFDFHVS